MSRLDASDTVRMRSACRVARPHRTFAHRQYASRLGRYCGNIRWMQSWIVTTDRQRVARRQHVVRLVHEVDAFARQRERNPELLARSNTAAPSPAPCGSSGPRTSPESTSSRPAQHHVLGVAIEARQLDQDVADVGADAEVAQLARVDGDSQLLRQPCPTARPSAEGKSQQAGPTRQVLLVVGEVAPAPHPLGVGIVRRRAPALMQDFGLRDVQHAASALRASPRTNPRPRYT